MKVCDRKSFQFVKIGDINDRELCFNYIVLEMLLFIVVLS